MQAKAAPAKWCWAWRTAAVSTCWSTCWVKPQDLFDEFAGKHKEHLGTGDVKYHMGFSSDMETEGGLVHWRWRLTRRTSRLSARWLSVPYAPVWIVWTSQAATKFCLLPSTATPPSPAGVVQETLNMSKARGYEVGGTVRIVINNRWASRPLTRWMRAQRRTAPTSVKWCRRRFSTSMRTIRKRSPSSPVWRLISAIPLNAMSSLTGVLPPSRPQRSR